MTRKEFIAELSTDFSRYDSANLINFRSVSDWIQQKIKRFGGNIMVRSEYVLKIENGKAKLPDNFWKLELAVKCEPSGYESDADNLQLITQDVFRIRVEENHEWNNMIEGHIKKDFTQIIEKVYVGSNYVNFYYKKPTILKITKGMKKDSCTSSCKNLQNIFTHNSPHEINILNNTLQANFSKGYIYIQYLGLPVDDEGDIYIPESQHGHLREYLMYHCKAKIMENLIGNKDEPDLIQMLQYYSAKEREYFSLAMTESKFEGLGQDWDVKLKNRMRRNTMAIENLFPNI